MKQIGNITPKRYERDRFAGEKKRGGSGSDRRTHVTTLQVGQEFNVTIEDLGHNGDGFVHIDDYTVFVRNTMKGEAVKIKLKKIKDTIAFADRI